jgi:hypothetical protein
VKILKIGVCLMAAALLCGCNPLMSASLNNLKAAVVGPDEVEVTPAEVAGVNYPQLKLTTPSGSGVLALVREREDLQFWVASGKQVLLLRDGLAVRSIGLGLEGDLDGTRLADNSPFKRGLHQVPDGFTTRRWIDLYKGQEVGVIVNSRFTRRATETLTILDKDYAVLRVDRPLVSVRPTVIGSIRVTVSSCRASSNSLRNCG